ncbi:MAG: amino acid ABC transporter substrate-binding protein [Pseudomonadota bacterium]
MTAWTRAAALIAAAAGALCALPVAAETTLERIERTGEIRLAVRRDAPPHSWMEAGAARGYSVEICLEAAKRIAKNDGLPGMAFVYVPVTAADRFEAIAEGRADLLCGAATVTLARRERVEFSLATFVDGAGVMLRAGEETDFSGLAGKRLGVLEDTTTARALRATLEGTGMAAEIVAQDAHDAAAAALLDGRIDAYFADHSILLFLAAAAADPTRLAIADNTLTVERHALALRKGDEAFRTAVDRALSQMHREGEMAAIFRRVFPGARPGPGLAALLLLGGLQD